MIGFYCFTQPTPPVVLTVKQKVALLSAGQKSGLLTAFINGVSVLHASRSLEVNASLVDYLYDLMDDMQARAKAYMRQEVIITPEVSHIDPVTHLKVVDTPAVMNTAPANQAALDTLLQSEYSSDLTSGQITAVINAMIKWSKFDGTGTWSFYQSQIIL
jgi:hypothetical protein